MARAGEAQQEDATGQVQENLDLCFWGGDGLSQKPWHPLHRPAPFPVDEEERLEVLLSQGILDTGPEPDYDALTAICQRAFRVPIAAITLLDRDRQWAKARINLESEEIDRDISFCAHTLLEEDVLVVPDLTQDERFKYNELVTVHGVRFYAGAPLLCPRGNDRKLFKLGCFCIMDSEPRNVFTNEDKAMLKVLASAVMTKLETKERKTASGPLASRWQEGGLEQRILALKACIAFQARTVDETCIRLFAERLRPRVFQSGTFITRRGDTGDPMYFIASGSCSCTLFGKELERLGKGQCFGEVSIINLCKMRSAQIADEEARKKCTRGADIQALERCEMLELRFEDAWPLIRMAPNLWFTLEGIAKRRAMKQVTPANGFDRSTSMDRSASSCSGCGPGQRP
mmetsp:Transcript_5936/g.13762  ORF Transcript_5936/g.13762 Transcript_5936/m.13762 type:complete len:401 (+) Transcript_5936:90-1292(+)